MVVDLIMKNSRILLSFEPCSFCFVEPRTANPPLVPVNSTMPRIASNHIFQEVFQKENGTSILTNLMELGTNLTESIDKASATLELQESAGDQKFVFFIIFFVLVPILTLCCVELVKVASDNYHSLMEGMQSKADSEGDIKKKVILKLFQTKFGSSARDALDSCLDQWHEVMPGLLKQAHIKPDEVPAKLIAARKNPRAFAMWVRHFLSMFMLAYLRAELDNVFQF